MTIEKSELTYDDRDEDEQQNLLLIKYLRVQCLFEHVKLILQSFQDKAPSCLCILVGGRIPIMYKYSEIRPIFTKNNRFMSKTCFIQIFSHTDCFYGYRKYDVCGSTF